MHWQPVWVFMDFYLFFPLEGKGKKTVFSFPLLPWAIRLLDGSIFCTTTHFWIFLNGWIVYVDTQNCHLNLLYRCDILKWHYSDLRDNLTKYQSTKSDFSFCFDFSDTSLHRWHWQQYCLQIIVCVAFMTDANIIVLVTLAFHIGE